MLCASKSENSVKERGGVSMDDDEDEVEGVAGVFVVDVLLLVVFTLWLDWCCSKSVGEMYPFCSESKAWKERSMRDVLP